mgnify:FL=1
MSNARNLANLLGTNTTIQTAKLADDAITAAKLSSTAIASGDLPAGTVLNHYNTTYDTQITVSADGWVDTGLSFNVTPVSTSSKFIINYDLFLYFVAITNSWNAAYARVRRDSTTVRTDSYTLGRGALYNISGTYAHVMMHTGDKQIDSPSTTSQITYKVQIHRYHQNTFYVNQGDMTGYIDITEIAG